VVTNDESAMADSTTMADADAKRAAVDETERVYDYASLKLLAEELDRPVKSVVTDMTTDPFYAGAPFRKAAAEWFKELWERFQFRHGVHLRRIHYVLVSTEVLDVSGARYLNTLNYWNDLKSASRDARYLGLVPIDAFVDQRTDEAIVHLSGHDEDSELHIEEPQSATVPTSAPKLSALRIDPLSSHILTSPAPLDPPSYEFKAPFIARRFHVEIWCEKATIADILEPLAREYGLNVMMGVGDMSLTRCYQLVKRACASKRPVRILYVSDFDPQGRNMPVGVARKIEFENRTKGLDLDVQVFPVALTHEQCVEHQLPRIPLKETVGGKARFEQRFGEGATELDANCANRWTRRPMPSATAAFAAGNGEQENRTADFVVMETHELPPDTQKVNSGL
jgi:hypothetical protein